MRIVLDPGHGGNDTGAVGPTGLNEADVALRVCLYLKERLQLNGHDTILTRVDNSELAADANMDIKRRRNMAKLNGCNAFISIHCGSADEGAGNGCTIWYLRGDGLSAQLADRVNRHMLAVGRLSGQSVKSTESIVLLKRSKVPAIQVDLALITDPSEEALLQDSQWIESRMNALAEALVEWNSKVAAWGGLEDEVQPESVTNDVKDATPLTTKQEETADNTSGLEPQEKAAEVATPVEKEVADTTKQQITTPRLAGSHAPLPSIRVPAVIADTMTGSNHLTAAKVNSSVSARQHNTPQQKMATSSPTTTPKPPLTTTSVNSTVKKQPTSQPATSEVASGSARATASQSKTTQLPIKVSAVVQTAKGKVSVPAGVGRRSPAGVTTPPPTTSAPKTASAQAPTIVSNRTHLHTGPVPEWQSEVISLFANLDPKTRQLAIEVVQNMGRTANTSPQ